MRRYNGAKRLATVPGEVAWRILFLLGIVAGAGAVFLVAGGAPQARPGVHPGLLAAAGLLVGLGTRVGNGCTSGHGVCGMARLAPRSIAATGVFLSVAMATTFVLRQLGALS